MELYNDWLVSKMTRAEVAELSEDEKKERRRLQQKKIYQENKKEIAEYNKEHKETAKARSKKWREHNPEQAKKYYQENKEKIAEYDRLWFQSPSGKKSNTLSSWKSGGLQESKENLDRIYELSLNQELCNACDIKLTRDGNRNATDVTMDHDHDTGRFRHIICKSCNNNDNWKQYFC